jgi:hypothetical protein
MKLFVFVILFSVVMGQAPDEEFIPDNEDIDIDPDINKWVVVTPNCYRPYGYERPILCFNDDLIRQDIIQLYPECPACPTVPPTFHPSSPPPSTTTTKTTTTTTSSFTRSPTTIRYKTSTHQSTTTRSARPTTVSYHMPNKSSFSEEFVFGCFCF